MSPFSILIITDSKSFKQASDPDEEINSHFEMLTIFYFFKIIILKKLPNFLNNSGKNWES